MEWYIFDICSIQVFIQIPRFSFDYINNGFVWHVICFLLSSFLNTYISEYTLLHKSKLSCSKIYVTASEMSSQCFHNFSNVTLRVFHATLKIKCWLQNLCIRGYFCSQNWYKNLVFVSPWYFFMLKKICNHTFSLTAPLSETKQESSECCHFLLRDSSI